MPLRWNAISNSFDLVSVGSGGGGAGYQPSATVASTGNLSADYDNGTLGVGATLTNNGAQAALQVDGVTVSVDDRVLVKDQSSQEQNGIYQVTVVGTGATDWVLTRVSTYDEASEINPGTVVAVLEGSTNANTLWQQQNEVSTVGTDPIVFDQIGGVSAGVYLEVLNNLSDLDDVSAARTNLGLGTAALDDTGDFLQVANDLSDLNDATTARSNLGLGSMALQASSSVSITGGSITGITDLALADGGTGASLANPGADRIMFWDDSAGAVDWLIAGTGLTITDKTIEASVSVPDLHTAKFIVGDTSEGANYSTIQAAINDASSGDTIFIQTGTYTEDLTLKAGVYLSSFGTDSSTKTGVSPTTTDPQVEIVGKASFLTGPGTVTFYGIGFKTNGDYCIESVAGGAGPKTVNLINCFIYCSDSIALSTGTTASTGCIFNLENCRAYCDSFGLFVTTASTASLIVIKNSYIYSQTTSVSASTGNVVLQNTEFLGALEVNGGFYAYDSQINAPSGTGTLASQNLTGVTLGVSILNQIYNCVIGGGTQSAIEIPSPASLLLYNSTISSSNTNAINGTGTINHGAVTFSGSSSLINVSTQNGFQLPEEQGTSGQVLTSNGAGALPTFEDATSGSYSINTQVFTSSGTYTPTSGMQHCIIEVVGGGGGGGGAANPSAGQLSVSGAGSGGEYARGVFSSATIGASQSVTVGSGGSGGAAGNNAGSNGGTTSVGSLITAVGGNGNVGGPSIANISRSGVKGGTGGTGGDFRSQGFSSSSGASAVGGGVAFVIGGAGGGSIYGSGGAGTSAGSTSSIGDGTGYGAGGSGRCRATGAGSAAGFNGSAGIVIITEFIL